jgi:translation initiation factor IF-3
MGELAARMWHKGTKPVVPAAPGVIIPALNHPCPDSGPGGYLLGRRRRGVPLPPPETNRARVNDRIKVPQIRLIDENGEQVGVVTSDDARRRALTAGLDLVEVAAEAKPPVCRIMDYGKFLFEQQKKDRAQKSHSHRSETKEVRLRPRTGTGDFDIKVKHAIEFLDEGYKVGVHVQFRGRELSHKELGLAILDRFRDALVDHAKIEQEPRQEGKRMVALFSPKPK